MGSPGSHLWKAQCTECSLHITSGSNSCGTEGEEGKGTEGERALETGAQSTLPPSQEALCS